MNIIIAGAGKVGFYLAKTLCIGHNVTIIDKNAQALQRIQESLDILPLKGDVEDIQTYNDFVHTHIDLFIAVTNIDNVNLVATLVADTALNIEKKIVRLQKPFFKDTSIAQRLQIESMIFPTQLASAGVASLLDYPKANNVKFFQYTDYKLISVMVSKSFTPQEYTPKEFVIVGIERDKMFFIPQTSSVEIIPNDLVYCFGDEEAIRNEYHKLEIDTSVSIQKCVVFGGDDLGVAIAKALVAKAKDVKLIEKDLRLCHKADEVLGGSVDIINAKYDTHDIFEDEGLEHADIFISATTNDEFNIIKSLEAKERGIKKVVAINNDMEYYNLMHSLGIIVVRGPKMSAYNAIMEEISSTGVVIQKSFCGAKANVFMRKIFPNSALLNKKVKPLKLDTTALFYMRDHTLYPFDTKIVLQEDDLLIAFTTQQYNSKIKQWIYEL